MKQNYNKKSNVNVSVDIFLSIKLKLAVYMEKKEFIKKLGQQVVKLRKQKGWSQAELARNCFKDRQSIERLENGKINPSAYYLYEVAKTLGISVKELLNF